MLRSSILTVLLFTICCRALNITATAACTVCDNPAASMPFAVPASADGKLALYSAMQQLQSGQCQTQVALVDFGASPVAVTTWTSPVGECFSSPAFMFHNQVFAFTVLWDQKISYVYQLNPKGLVVDQKSAFNIHMFVLAQDFVNMRVIVTQTGDDGVYFLDLSALKLTQVPGASLPPSGPFGGFVQATPENQTSFLLQVSGQTAISYSYPELVQVHSSELNVPLSDLQAAGVLTHTNAYVVYNDRNADSLQIAIVNVQTGSVVTGPKRLCDSVQGFGQVAATRLGPDSVLVSAFSGQDYIGVQLDTADLSIVASLPAAVPVVLSVWDFELAADGLFHPRTYGLSANQQTRQLLFAELTANQK